MYEENADNEVPLNSGLSIAPRTPKPESTSQVDILGFVLASTNEPISPVLTKISSGPTI